MTRSSLADNKGTIISWNKGAQLIFGYEEQELLGKPLHLIFPDRYLANHQEHLKVHFPSRGE